MRSGNKLLNFLQRSFQNMALHGLKEFISFDLAVIYYFIIPWYVSKLLYRFNLEYDVLLLITYISLMIYSIILYSIFGKSPLTISK